VNKPRILVAVGVAAGFAFASSAAVFAGPPSAEPDLHIKKTGKPYEGDDVVNLTGVGQTVKKLTFPTQAAKFKFRVENDGFGSGEIFVRGSGSDPEFRVRYRASNGDNITQLVDEGTQSFILASMQRSAPVTILVTPKPAAPFGALKTVRVTATHATTDVDRVRAKVENGLPGE
jgi:hypothetical protein